MLSAEYPRDRNVISEYAGVAVLGLAALACGYEAFTHLYASIHDNLMTERVRELMLADGMNAVNIKSIDDNKFQADFLLDEGCTLSDVSATGQGLNPRHPRDITSYTYILKDQHISAANIEELTDSHHLGPRPCQTLAVTEK